jgi:hypothetical protein
MVLRFAGVLIQAFLASGTDRVSPTEQTGGRTSTARLAYTLISFEGVSIVSGTMGACVGTLGL